MKIVAGKPDNKNENDLPDIHFWIQQKSNDSEIAHVMAQQLEKPVIIATIKKKKGSQKVIITPCHIMSHEIDSVPSLLTKVINEYRYWCGSFPHPLEG